MSVCCWFFGGERACLPLPSPPLVLDLDLVCGGLVSLGGVVWVDSQLCTLLVKFCFISAIFFARWLLFSRGIS